MDIEDLLGDEIVEQAEELICSVDTAGYSDSQLKVYDDAKAVYIYMVNNCQVLDDYKILDVVDYLEWDREYEHYYSCGYPYANTEVMPQRMDYALDFLLAEGYLIVNKVKGRYIINPEKVLEAKS